MADELDHCRIELILGPMGSGKSTELRRRLQIRSIYTKVLGANTNKDTRFGSNGIITRDNIRFDCPRVGNLNELRELQEYKDARVIGIDEGNFFPEIADFVNREVQLTNKSFIICGLAGDKDKEFFGNLHLLIPKADDITFLKAICRRCGGGATASFSIDIVPFEGQEKVGDSETYEPVCSTHYGTIRYQQYVKTLKTSRPDLKLSFE